ncbi:serine/threonine protein phosphatase [bacterium C-53]|nr:serine/threonine protein phosphatase [Lachnospiraceae bacterium]NBI03703.1 serine/threonine protein phosphatase [Lachnospiraceae bacterium]RKJ09261.1 serine/threonine protein phosphatase [bacterium C-53]
MSRRLDRVYEKAPVLTFPDYARLVFMSDCHRGVGNGNDNFEQNQNLCFAALQYYYANGFTYFELGDGEELWENRSLSKIVETYGNIYWFLREFYRRNRLYMIYGNHDYAKHKPKYVRKNYASFYNDCTNRWEELFPDLKICEAYRVRIMDTEIFLLHGHQCDLLNDYLHVFTKWMVRYVWGPLEMIGLKAPAGPTESHRKAEKGEKRFLRFAKDKNIYVLCGHTHEARLGEDLYLNDGSMVHPRCITAIEIVGREICLVKWEVTVNPCGYLMIHRTVLEEKRELKPIARNGHFYG